MAKDKRAPAWWGKDWTAAVPLWDREHPLFKEVGAQRSDETVTTEYGSAEIKVPDLGDDLAPVVAACAVYFGGRFIKAHRISPYVALESIAYLYCSVGGTPQVWREFLVKIGVNIAPQSQNNFITFL